jgi:ferrochelatase
VSGGIVTEPFTGIVLMNLGGPPTLEDVEPFLLNLFRDPDILPLPGLARALLARLIVRRRLAEVRHRYGLIGGGSPLLRWTNRQAELLEASLREDGIRAHVTVAMRYYAPRAEEAVHALLAHGRPERVLALPCYPHESIATTGSSTKDLQAALAARCPDVPFALVRSYCDQPLYIAALAECVRAGLAQFAPGDPVALLFSAHSLPRRFIDRGDPYLAEIERTRALLLDELGWQGPQFLAFQSKAGPVRWLEPTTDAALIELGKTGHRRLLVVPISFISDHIETLFEVDMLYADQAKAAGIVEFRRMPSLNDSPTFITALSAVVRARLQAAQRPVTA